MGAKSVILILPPQHLPRQFGQMNEYFQHLLPGKHKVVSKKKKKIGVILNIYMFYFVLPPSVSPAVIVIMNAVLLTPELFEITFSSFSTFQISAKSV
jgi:hypothetical protein